MRSFISFLGLFVIGFAAMAVLTYPAWLVLYPAFDFPFHRVGSRIGMLALVVGFWLMSRRLGVTDRASLGYGLPRRQFLRELLVGLALGVALMLPVAAMMVALDLRVLREGVTLDLATFASIALLGLARGLAVALIEETFIRGAMFTAIERESGTRRAIVFTALLYAAAHFLAKFRIPADEVTWSSGLDLVAGSLRVFGDPLLIIDAFLSLFAVGLLLGLVRAITGNIAACIGLHAGWVWIIAFMTETSSRDPHSSLAFLVSGFHGFVGWLVLAWTLLIGTWLYRYYARRAARRTAAAAVRSAGGV